jgi:hypothetical protein
MALDERTRGLIAGETASTADTTPVDGGVLASETGSVDGTNHDELAVRGAGGGRDPRETVGPAEQRAP